MLQQEMILCIILLLSFITETHQNVLANRNRRTNNIQHTQLNNQIKRRHPLSPPRSEQNDPVITESKSGRAIQTRNIPDLNGSARQYQSLSGLGHNFSYEKKRVTSSSNINSRISPQRPNVNTHSRSPTNRPYLKYPSLGGSRSKYNDFVNDGTVIGGPLGAVKKGPDGSFISQPKIISRVYKPGSSQPIVSYLVGYDGRSPQGGQPTTVPKPVRRPRRPRGHRDDRRPSQDNRRSSRENRRPSRDNRRPSRENRRPSRDNRRPSGGNRRQSRGRRPTVPPKE